jgi:hypothetical protein
MTKTYDHLLYLSQAGANVLHLASYEWERVRGLVIGLAGQQSLPLRIWSQSTGVLQCSKEGTPETEDDSATDPLEVLKQIHRSDEAGVWLLEDFQPFLREDQHPIHRWLRELARIPASPRKVVVLSTPLPGLPIDLRKEIPTIELALPGVDDLQVVLEDAAKTLRVKADADVALLDAARGLTVMEARLAFGKAAAELGRLDHGAVPLVAREKERIIKQSEVLEYYPTDARMTDVGGLDQLKVWLDRRGRAFGAGARDFGLDAPKGVLLLGVQGCGKSLLAKAVAATWQFPLLRFDMGKVFGGIVGQSEANIRTALQVAQALAPCVLWIDEIEKGWRAWVVLIRPMVELRRVSLARCSPGCRRSAIQYSWSRLQTGSTCSHPSCFARAASTRSSSSICLLPPSARRSSVDPSSKKRREPKDFDLQVPRHDQSVGFSGAELEEACAKACTTPSQRAENWRRNISSARWTRPSRCRGRCATRSRACASGRRCARGLRAVSARGSAARTSSDSLAPRLRQETTRNPFIPVRSLVKVLFFHATAATRRCLPALMARRAGYPAAVPPLPRPGHPHRQAAAVPLPAPVGAGAQPAVDSLEPLGQPAARAASARVSAHRTGLRRKEPD